MALNTPDALEGRVLSDRFRVANVISSGANTIIADGIDLTDDAPVTIKIVQPDLAAIEGFASAFRRRIEVATGLVHPNIARVVGWGEVRLGDNADGSGRAPGDEAVSDDDPEEPADTLFWVVEYLGGGSLRDLLDRGRSLTPSQALVVGLEACRALDAAHQSGVVHTELTPSKLVFGNDQRLRIVDFAMAELLGAVAWENPAALPTHVAAYASPEQATQGEVGPRTDVYSLALMLVEAMTGSVPFAGDSTVATLAARVDRLLPVSADFGSLASPLEHAGRPDAEDRSTASEFARELVAAASGLSRPEPIEIVATGRADTSDLARQALAAAAAAAVDVPNGDGLSDGDDVPSGDAAPDIDEHTPSAAASPSIDAPIAAATLAAAAAGASDTETTPIDSPPVATATTTTDQLPATQPLPVPGAPPAVPPPAARDAQPEDAAPVGPSPAGLADATADVNTGSGDDIGADAAIESGADATIESGADAAIESRADATSGSGIGVVAATAATAAAVGAVSEGHSDSHTGEVPAAAGAVDAAPATPATAATPVVSQPVDASGATADPDRGAGGGEAVIAFDDAPITQPPGPATAATTEQLVTAQSGDTVPLPQVAGAAAATGAAVGAATVTGGPELYDAERKGRTGTIIAFSLVILAGVAALSYAGWLLLRTKSFEMPDLVGQPEAVALNEVAGNDWQAVRSTARSDEFPDPGTVIRTDPAAGVVLDEGASFQMVVSEGPEFRTLPELVGQPFDEAVATLDALGLIGVQGGEEFSETQPPGTVLAWEVTGDATLIAGAQVLPGRTVVMTVSIGPAPREVPNVAGNTTADARAALDELGLMLAEGEPQFSDDVAAGLIIAQDPAPGVNVERGATVTVTVSRGPDLVVLPDLGGLSFDDAVALLTDTGFEVGDVLGTTEGFFESLTIDGEPATPGTEFRRGTEVDLVFI